MQYSETTLFLDSDESVVTFKDTKPVKLEDIKQAMVQVEFSRAE